MSKKGGPKQQKDEIKYEINEIVLGKLRGFPAWPGQVRIRVFAKLSEHTLISRVSPLSLCFRS